MERSGSRLVVTLPSDREIVMRRVFDAPRTLVFEAHTKPEQVTRWWGVGGSKMTVCDIDLRPGGAWRWVLIVPDGGECAFRGVYHEIVPPERLVYTEIFEPYPDNPGLITTIFEEQDGRTTLTSTALYESVEVRDMVVQSGMESGAAETYDRLAELLATLA
ncbi:MAG: SRPBCC family protein [Chloroflexi bacterium]|nr:SRPBCC family protein [Chloroflexota bacterium]